MHTEPIASLVRLSGADGQVLNLQAGFSCANGSRGGGVLISESVVYEVCDRSYHQYDDYNDEDASVTAP